MNPGNAYPDQASTLRTIAGARSTIPLAPHPRRKKGVRVISVTSGKGGVGKSNVVANLAIAFARRGERVLVIDADLGVGNLDVLLGLSPRATLDQVLAGEKRLDEVIMEGPAGIKLVPAGSGIQDFTALGSRERLRLLDELDRLEEEFDLVIVDTAAGVSENVTYFSVAAREIVAVVSPEPTSIADVYALIKILATRYGEREFRVLVNMARDERDARQVFHRLAQVAARFLDVSLDYVGCVLRDDLLVAAVKQQRAVLEMYPTARASRCFTTLARTILDTPSEQGLKGNIQFFSRKMVSHD